MKRPRGKAQRAQRDIDLQLLITTISMQDQLISFYDSTATELTEIIHQWGAMYPDDPGIQEGVQRLERAFQEAAKTKASVDDMRKKII